MHRVKFKEKMHCLDQEQEQSLVNFRTTIAVSRVILVCISLVIATLFFSSLPIVTCYPLYLYIPLSHFVRSFVCLKVLILPLYHRLTMFVRIVVTYVSFTLSFSFFPCLIFFFYSTQHMSVSLSLTATLS